MNTNSIFIYKFTILCYTLYPVISVLYNYNRLVMAKVLYYIIHINKTPFFVITDYVLEK